MRLRGFILTATLCAAASTTLASVTVTGPPADSIVFAASATIQGVSTSPSVTSIAVSRGSVKLSARVDSLTGTWAVPNFPLQAGLNAITVQTVPATPPPTVIFVTRGDPQNMTVRPLQRVRFVWDADAEVELEAIARGTLSGPLSNDDVATFISQVKAQISSVFVRDYHHVANIQIVDADGDDVHTVHFLGVDSGLFGQSPGDCGNTILQQESSVFVGTFRDQMVRSFADWSPMQKTDALGVRVTDVAEAIGRTAAHETGHSLGLVADNGPCQWMGGCDGFHSCFALQQINDGLSRFGGGFFIMDPGGRSANQARIGEATREARGQRRPAVFCRFDQNYLAIIEPAP